MSWGQVSKQMLMLKLHVILGNESTGVSDAVSGGNDTQQRRIVYVADPTSKYDAVNKNPIYWWIKNNL